MLAMGNQSKFARGRQQQRWEGEREENNNNNPPAEPMLPAPALALVMSTVDSQLESARNQPNEPLRESAYVEWLTMALLAGWLAGQAKAAWQAGLGGASTPSEPFPLEPAGSLVLVSALALLSALRSPNWC